MLFAQFPFPAACLLFILFNINPTFSQHAPFPLPPDPITTFTTNVTSVVAGEPFTARCRVTRYDVRGDEYLAFVFGRKSSRYVDEYLIEYQYVVNNSTGQRNWKIVTNYSYHGDLAIDLHPSTIYPACEVTMRPTILNEDDEYWCQFAYKGSGSWYRSHSIAISVREPIRTTFFSDVREVAAGQPFMARCHLEELVNATNRSYSVQFWSSEGLLGTYLVNAPKQSTTKPFVLFKSMKYGNTTVASHGARAAYPTFDIQINTTDASPIYWCSLRDERQREYKSNTWPAPDVSFTANVSAHEDGIPFTGRCSVTKFLPADTTYSVGFFADKTGLLATYVVRPNEPLDLVIEDHHPNVTISQGVSVQLPTYELSINLTGPSQYFWCTLQFGQQFAKTMEFRSYPMKL